jgi:hypothetical protein
MPSPKSLFTGIGRLRNGASRTQAQVELKTLAAALAAEYPATDEGHSVTVSPVRDVLFGAASTAPILYGSVVLSAVVGIVLLIACSNVANLLLARRRAERTWGVQKRRSSPGLKCSLRNLGGIELRIADLTY